MTTKFEILKLKVQSVLGNTEALYLLGYNYLYGIGVEPDLRLAYQYLLNASNKCFTHARELLRHAFANNGESSQLSEDFKGVYKDVCGLCQAADNGDPCALHLKNMAKLSDDTDDYMFNRGVSQMKQAAEKKYAPALFSLGMVYIKGNRIKG